MHVLDLLLKVFSVHLNHILCGFISTTQLVLQLFVLTQQCLNRAILLSVYFL